MNRGVLIVGLFVAVIALGSALLIGGIYRATNATGNDGVATFRINRFTGAVSVCLVAPNGSVCKDLPEGSPITFPNRPSAPEP